MELICTCEFFKKRNCTHWSGSCNFSFLKNSLVQINSNLNSKPYDYLHENSYSFTCFDHRRTHNTLKTRYQKYWDFDIPTLSEKKNISKWAECLRFSCPVLFSPTWTSSDSWSKQTSREHLENSVLLFTICWHMVAKICRGSEGKRKKTQPMLVDHENNTLRAYSYWIALYKYKPNSSLKLNLKRLEGKKNCFAHQTRA